MLVTTPEIDEAADRLKKDKFYDKPYSVVYRYMLETALPHLDFGVTQNAMPSNDAIAT